MASVGYHGAVSEFKRRLIEAALYQFQGNRSRAARALGLQRTYLLRLMRDLGVAAPPAAPGVRRPIPGMNGETGASNGEAPS
jgi:DNA-binding NtrC family response regulator